MTVPKKLPKQKKVDPTKASRGHTFGKAGRSATFKSKKDYRRKSKKNQTGIEPSGD